MAENIFGIRIEGEVIDTNWMNEKSRESSGPVFVRGLVDGVEKGILQGRLVIDRFKEGNVFSEKTRSAILEKLEIENNIRETGLEDLMIKNFEKFARDFGALKISGTVDAESWLPNIYKRLGFKVERKELGYIFEKEL